MEWEIELDRAIQILGGVADESKVSLQELSKARRLALESLEREWRLRKRIRWTKEQLLPSETE